MIYLDYAATTPLSNKTYEALTTYLKNHFYNASSSYNDYDKVIINKLKEKVARIINADPEQILITSGASESNAIALNYQNNVLSTPIEHDSVLYQSYDKNFDYVKIDYNGRVIVEDLINKLYKKNYDIVSIMMVNNEIGMIEPIKTICKICHDNNVVVHTDATQGFGHIDIDVKELDVDFLSGSFHKVGGIKGCGFLYHKYPISYPLIYGAQQSRQRGGTFNMPGIVSALTALDDIEDKIDDNLIKVITLDIEFRNMLKQLPYVEFITKDDDSSPYILNVRFKGIRSEELLYWLEMNQIFCSSGSACNSSDGEVSHVLKAIGLSDEVAGECIRFSLHPTLTNIGELKEVVRKIDEFYNRKYGR